ncbi:MAG: hypothetical protein HY692_08380 [Cyanobacteria bacterium NC_groundwater_1444_Ag_S-0.65um_54_12]|nr:hypothetical protein [Cyanobacteria bacterium NC_groundwater_1444_Ag_S-0.65um_54_12]
MSEVLVGGKKLDNPVLIKLNPGSMAHAKIAAKRNGADDVFITVGKDLFVASGRGWDLKGGIANGTTATVNGKPGKTIASDNQLNTASEGFRQAWKSGFSPGLSFIAVATISGGVVGEIVRNFRSPNAPSTIVPLFKMTTVAVAGAISLVSVVAALYGKFRKVDFTELERLPAMPKS